VRTIHTGHNAHRKYRATLHTYLDPARFVTVQLVQTDANSSGSPRTNSSFHRNPRISFMSVYLMVNPTTLVFFESGD
jgi:hypothetical protein